MIFEDRLLCDSNQFSICEMLVELNRLFGHCLANKLVWLSNRQMCAQMANRNTTNGALRMVNSGSMSSMNIFV